MTNSNGMCPNRDSMLRTEPLIIQAYRAQASGVGEAELAAEKSREGRQAESSSLAIS